MQAVGIEFISVFGLPPVAFTHLAADLGCRWISVVLEPLAYNPEGYPPYSLRKDAGLRRETKQALADRGVSISLVEGFVVRPGGDVGSYAADLEIAAELGAPCVSTLSFDPDLPRSLDQFALLAEMAAAAGVQTRLEFAPSCGVPDLPTALAAWRHVGREDFKLTLDTMHVVRSGASAADLARLDRAAVGYVQLCDAPRAPALPDYLEEARFERKAPGAGELPLVELLAVLPPIPVIGLEVPLRAQAEAGAGPRERMAPVVKAARELLAQVEALTTAGDAAPRAPSP